MKRKKWKKNKREREKEKSSLMRADLSSILFRNAVLTASYVRLQYSVIDQCDGSKLLLNAKNLCLKEDKLMFSIVFCLNYFNVIIRKMNDLGILPSIGDY